MTTSAQAGICRRVIGKPKNKAIQKIEINGFKCRIASTDGEAHGFDNPLEERTQNRVNLVINNGVVTDAYFG